MSSVGSSFVLIRRLADGTVEWIPLEMSAQGVTVVPDAAYTLVDRADYEAPDALVAQRRGEDLVVEVQGNEVLVLRGFYTNADVTFYPTTNIAGGAGPFSGAPLTANSPVLAGSSAGEQVVWSAEPTGGKAVAAASEQAGAGPTAPAAGGAVAGSSGGGSPLLWVGVAAGGLGLAAAAGGGGGGSSGGGGGGTPVVDTVAPTITSGATATAMAENSGAGQVVYTTTATDAGAISYSLRAVGDAAAFTINANTGAVTLTGNPNFETKSTYTFTVAATDAANNSSERAVTLAINNRDEIAPTITSGATATAINENSGSGQVVYTVTSTDTGDTSTGNTTYSLKAGGDAAAFTINANTGAVTLTGNPDFETQSSYSFTVIATDVALNSSERAVSLAINNIDENAPSVSSVALTGATGAVNNTLNAGDTVQVTAAMSENTNVTGTPRIALNIGGGTVFANYLSGSGSTSLLFQYTILASQNDSNGISIAANALQLNGGSLTDASGNAANLAHVAVADNASFRVDTAAPSVSNLAMSAIGAQNSTLNAGDFAQVTVTMSENTTVSTVGGTPRIGLDIGGTTVFANYVSGSGSTSLVFRYTVQAGQSDANGISIAANALQANGGSFTDAAGNVAVLTHASVANNPALLVDTIAPSVSNVALSGAIGRQNNTLNAGDSAQVTVTMSENTTVSGTPRIALNIDGTTVFANYLSGSGGTSLVFQYTILAGQTDTNGISIAANALQLNGGSLTDAGGNAANLAHAAVANNPSFLVDTSVPSVSNVTLTATGAQNDRLNAGDVVSVTVTMSENTVVAGTPSIGLSIGGDNVNARYVSGNGTATLVFEYTILAGQTDNNGISVDANSIALNGGSITDAAGNAADLRHSGVGHDSDFVVDTTAPTLSSSNPADDETDVDTDDDLELEFSENVQAGSGNIAIDSDLDDRTFDINGPRISISGNDVTINPILDLSSGTAYSVQIDAGAITDLAGNPYAGISNTTTLNFQTEGIVVSLGFAEEPQGARTFQAMSAPIAVSAFGDDAMTGDDAWTGADDLGSADRALLTGADASAPSALAYTSGGATAGSSPFAPSSPAALGGTDFVAFANVPGLTSQGLA